MPHMPDSQYLTVVFVVFTVASTSVAATGFGAAMIWNSGMRFASEIIGIKYNQSQVVNLLAFAETFVNTVLLCSSNQSLDMQVAVAGGIPLLLGSAAGNYLLLHWNMALIGQILGGLIVLHCSYTLWGMLKEDIPSNQSTQTVGAVTSLLVASLCGIVAGLTGGCSGIIGPVFAIFFMRSNMDKTTIRTMMNFWGLETNLINLVLTMREGVLDVEADWYVVVVMLLACAIGLGVGTCLHKKASDVTLRYAVLILCMIASCSLLGRGSLSLTAYVVLANAVLLTILVIAQSGIARWGIGCEQRKDDTDDVCAAEALTRFSRTISATESP